MYTFDSRKANQPAFKNQIHHAHYLTARQRLDVEALCTLEFKKEFADLIAHEANQLIEWLR